VESAALELADLACGAPEHERRPSCCGGRPII